MSKHIRPVFAVPETAAHFLTAVETAVCLQTDGGLSVFVCVTIIRAHPHPSPSGIRGRASRYLLFNYCIAVLAVLDGIAEGVYFAT